MHSKQIEDLQTNSHKSAIYLSLIGTQNRVQNTLQSLILNKYRMKLLIKQTLSIVIADTSLIDSISQPIIGGNWARTSHSDEDSSVLTRRSYIDYPCRVCMAAVLGYQRLLLLMSLCLQNLGTLIRDVKKKKKKKQRQLRMIFLG